MSIARYLAVVGNLEFVLDIADLDGMRKVGRKCISIV